MQSEGSASRCLACARRCRLSDGQVGYCSAVVNRGQAPYGTTYSFASEVNVTPIESKPEYHFCPGARVLSIGSLGCTLHCQFCQHWEVAFRDARSSGGLLQPNLAPADAVALALARRCQGIAFTFNEPSISPVYVRDCSRLAHDAGLFTVYVTDGLMTQEASDFLGPWLDVYRVDVKGLPPSFCRSVGTASRTGEVIPVARRAKVQYNMHVEVVRNLMPGLNDSDEDARQLASLVLELLGADTPDHFMTYVPYAMMTHIPPTSAESLARSRQIALRIGLQFMYTDSVALPESAHTCCSVCNTRVVARTKTRVRLEALAENGACSRCGAWLGTRTSGSGSRWL